MPKDNDELYGFKEFLEGDKTGINQKSGNAKRPMGGFELLTFLEQDSIRIQKLINLYEEKAYILKNYSQFQQLQFKAQFNRDRLKKKLMEKLKSDNAELYKRLSEIFNTHFTN